jgi:hypothetical protein
MLAASSPALSSGHREHAEFASAANDGFVPHYGRPLLCGPESSLCAARRQFCGRLHQAARTLLRKFATSALRTLLSLESELAEPEAETAGDCGQACVGWDVPNIENRPLLRKECQSGAHLRLCSRKRLHDHAKLAPKEFQGPKRPEPTRYGDWENKGIASDF